MGIIRMGPPEELLTTLAQKFSIVNFIETGTYYGGTAIWASEIFSQVFTIEFSEQLYLETSEKYKSVENIDFLWGDSRKILTKLLDKIEEPSLFWLDAHWSGGITYGNEDQCPLLEEINIINQSPCQHYIFIDDARLFLSPPQPPHDVSKWPSISQIIHALESNQNKYYIVIIEDVIIAVPLLAKTSIIEYCQNVNAIAWQQYGESIKKSDLQKGFDLIFNHFVNKSNSLAKKISRKTSKVFNRV